MGNVPSPSAAATDADYAPTREDYYVYKGKKCEPSQRQVDLAYAAMVKAYEATITNRWYGVDKEMLLRKLLDKVQEEHPELISELSSIYLFINNNSDKQQQKSSPYSPANPKKRKVIGGPMIIHGLRIPREVVAHIVPYCDDRSSVTNFSLSCRGAHQIIQDRRVVPSIPWPKHNFPWPESTQWGTVRYFVTSKDMSRFAVVRNKRVCADFHHIEIWDQWYGLIRELGWRTTYYSPVDVKPVFSLDGGLLLTPLWMDDKGHSLLGPVRIVKGVRIVQVCSGAEIEHNFNVRMNCMTFVGNNGTIAVLKGSETQNNDVGNDDGNNGIDLWEIDEVNGIINNMSFSRTILDDLLENKAVKVTSFVWENKTLLAILPEHNTNRIIFYDLTDNVSYSKHILDNGRINDLSFSPSGQLVLARSGNNARRSHLLLFDININNIDGIGPPRVICPCGDGNYSDIIAFSADGARVVLGHEVRQGASLRCVRKTLLIDLKKEEVLVDHFLGGDSWEGTAWNKFSH